MMYIYILYTHDLPKLQLQTQHDLLLFCNVFKINLASVPCKHVNTKKKRKTIHLVIPGTENSHRIAFSFDM